MRVNHKTGLPAGPGDKSAIMEAFKPGQEPAGSVVADDGRDGEMVGDDYGCGAAAATAAARAARVTTGL